MAMDFEIDEYEDGRISVQSIIIDGDRYDGNGVDDSVAVPVAALAKVLLKELDKRIWFQPADAVSDDFIMLRTVPYRLRALDDASAEIVFEELNRRKLWNGPVGLQRYMEAKKEVIADRQTMSGGVRR